MSEFVCNAKLFNYQKEFLESKESTIICNWSRGTGRSLSACLKILKEKPKNVLYVDYHKTLKVPSEKFKEIRKYFNMDKYMSSYKEDKYRIQIKDIDGNYINIYSNSIENRGYIRDNIDMIIFDNMLPYNLNINAKQIISMININNYNKQIQRLFCNTYINEVDYIKAIELGLLSSKYIDEFKKYPSFYDEFAILDKPESNFIDIEYSDRKREVYENYAVDFNNKFYIDTLIKLQEEYDKIDNNKDTVLTRQNLLHMIIELKRELNKN